MAQKIFFTRKTSLTFLFLLFLRNLNICCICCGCCYDDLLKNEYSFMWDNDSKEKYKNNSKEKYKDDFLLRTEKWEKEKKKEEKKRGFDFKPEIKRSPSFDNLKKKILPLKKRTVKKKALLLNILRFGKSSLVKKFMNI